VAVTVLAASVPKTTTWEPTLTSASDGVPEPNSMKVVLEDTSTVTVVLFSVVKVNESAPTEATVPMATGGVPPKSG
jgi:hypothetical protein